MGVPVVPIALPLQFAGPDFLHIPVTASGENSAASAVPAGWRLVSTRVSAYAARSRLGATLALLPPATSPDSTHPDGLR